MEEQMTNAQKIWAAMKKYKKLYIRTLPIAFILACLYTLNMPNIYEAEVTLVPEGGGGGMGSLASIASSFGVNIGGGGRGEDAITPSLYPELMNSNEFRVSLFNLKVRKDGEDREIPYWEYLAYEQKDPWLTRVRKSFFGLFTSKKAEKPRMKMENVNPFRLTKDERSMVNAIGGNVKCTSDRRSDVLFIRVKDVDPLVAATVADSLKERLQKAITDYRTKKARHDLAYIEQLYKESKVKYEKSCELYADFIDSNQSVMLETVRLKQTKLENEMQLLYNNYNAISSELLAAKAKVQEKTPAFTTLQGATVPLDKSGPKRSRIVALFVLFVFLCETTWILYKEDQLKLLFGLKKNSEKK